MPMAAVLPRRSIRIAALRPRKAGAIQKPKPRTNKCESCILLCCECNHKATEIPLACIPCPAGTQIPRKGCGLEQVMKQLDDLLDEIIN
jgi:hypothetical protein